MKLIFEEEINQPTQAEINAAIERVRQKLAALITSAATVSPVVAQVQANPETTTVTSPVAPVAVVESAQPEISLPSKAKCLEVVFNKLKKTEKTSTILEALLDTTEAISLQDLAEATGLDSTGLSNWFAVTGRKIKAITNPSRGMYKFDRTKIKV